MYNYTIGFIAIIILYVFRRDIITILSRIVKITKEDISWLREDKVKAVLLSFILPLWLHLLLYMANYL